MFSQKADNFLLTRLVERRKECRFHSEIWISRVSCSLQNLLSSHASTAPMLMMMMMDRPDSTTVLSYGHHQRPQQQQHPVHNLQQPVPGTSTSAAAAISAPLLFSGLDAFGDNLTQVNKKCKLKKNLSLDRRNAQIFSLSLSLSSWQWSVFFFTVRFIQQNSSQFVLSQQTVQLSSAWDRGELQSLVHTDSLQCRLNACCLPQELHCTAPLSSLITYVPFSCPFLREELPLLNFESSLCKCATGVLCS